MTHSTITAVLIDTVSIQPYVFGSNKLKENIGASYIISQLVFGDVLLKALQEAAGKKGSIALGWEENPGEAKIADNTVAAEVAYIGGGNAMMLLRPECVDAFIKAHSLAVLLHFPGLRLAYGKANCAPGDLDNEAGFLKLRKALQDDLVRNKNQGFRKVNIPKHGVYQDCAASGETAEVRKDGREVSKAVEMKLDALELAQEAIMAPLKDSPYGFSTELDKLGQPDDKGYIAVVHLDGNGVGKKFGECKTLEELRNLSIRVSALANGAMSDLVQELCGLFPNGKLKGADDFELRSKEGKWLLPFRPLLVGGDDICFVCEGRLGVYLSKRMIEIMEGGPHDRMKVSACAGVAIVKTKYPFYRAYELAEALMRQAKVKAKEKDGSWLSFLISSSGFNGSLDEILEAQYKTPDSKKLFGGPYSLDEQSPRLSRLLSGVLHFQNAWPRSKAMALRDTLYRTKAEQDYFHVEAEAADLKLPNGMERIWGNSTKTTLHDMLDLINFYPKTLQSHDVTPAH